MFAKIGPLRNLNAALARDRVVLEDLRAGDVRGHEVGRELDAAELEIEDLGEGRNEEGLRQARNADQQAVPIREEDREQLLHDGVLSDDHLAQLGQDLGAGALKLFEKAHIALRGGLGHGVFLGVDGSVIDVTDLRAGMLSAGPMCITDGFGIGSGRTST